MKIIEIDKYSEYVPMMFFLEDSGVFSNEGKRIFKFWKILFGETPFKDWDLQKIGKYQCEHSDFKTTDIKDNTACLPNIKMTYCQDCGKMEEYQEYRADKYNFDC